LWQNLRSWSSTIILLKNLSRVLRAESRSSNYSRSRMPRGLSSFDPTQGDPELFDHSIGFMVALRDSKGDWPQSSLSDNRREPSRRGRGAHVYSTPTLMVFDHTINKFSNK